jgi:hypothetical protein
MGAEDFSWISKRQEKFLLQSFGQLTLMFVAA